MAVRLRPIPWLVIGVCLVSCGGTSTPSGAVTPTPLAVSAASASDTPAAARPSDTPSAPMPAPETSETPASTGPVAALGTLTCAPDTTWTQNQDGLTLAVCFDPSPPQLGRSAVYEVLLADAAGQAVSDATVEITLVGGMAGMLGEHDEDFSFALDSHGAGMYTAQATIGPLDLVLAEIRIGIKRGRQFWTFMLPVEELAPH